MKKLYYLLLLIAVSFYSCQKKEVIESYDIGPILNLSLEKLKTQDTAKLDLCQINEFEWDELLIVHPYATMSFLDGLDIENKSSIKEEMKSVEANDFRTLYLFINKNNIVRYQILTHTDYPINLNTVNHQTIRNKLPKIDLCSKLYIERKGHATYLKM